MNNDNLPIDDLLAQATCAVLIDGKIVGTAWLVSDDGYLLTAGHILGIDEPVDEVEVRFLKNQVYQVYKVEWCFESEVGIDFAVLKLIDWPTDCIPLPISLTKSVEGTFRLRGYGVTLLGQSVGQGDFLGAYELPNNTGNRLFQLRSPELGEEGYSGAAVFSDQLRAVVAVQVEATRKSIGAGRNTVLAIPLYRIAQIWPFLYDIAKSSPTNSLPTESSQIDYQPFTYPENAYSFENRTQDLKNIFFLLESNPYLHLYGPSGIGKTYLVRELLKKNYIENNQAYINFKEERFQAEGLSIERLLGNVCNQFYNTCIKKDLSLEKIVTKLVTIVKESSKYGVVILDNIDHMASVVRDRLRHEILSMLQKRINDSTKYLRIIVITQTKLEELSGFNRIYFENYPLIEFGPYDLPAYKNLLVQAIDKYSNDSFDFKTSNFDNLLQKWAYTLYDITGGHPKAITNTLDYVGRKTKFSWPDIFDDQLQAICQEVLKPLIDQQVQANLPKITHQKAFRLLWVFRYLSRSVFKQLLKEVKGQSHWHNLNAVTRASDYHPEYAPLWERFQETALLESDGISYSRLPHRLTPIWRKQGNLILQVTEPALYQKLHCDAAAVFEYFVFDKSTNDTSMRLSCFIEMLYHLTQEAKMEQESQTKSDFTEDIQGRLSEFISLLKNNQFFEAHLYNLKKLLENDKELRKELNKVGKEDTDQILVKMIKERM